MCARAGHSQGPFGPVGRQVEEVPLSGRVPTGRRVSGSQHPASPLAHEASLAPRSWSADQEHVATGPRRPWDEGGRAIGALVIRRTGSGDVGVCSGPNDTSAIQPWPRPRPLVRIVRLGGPARYRSIGPSSRVAETARQQTRLRPYATKAGAGPPTAAGLHRKHPAVFTSGMRRLKQYHRPESRFARRQEACRTAHSDSVGLPS